MKTDPSGTNLHTYCRKNEQHLECFSIHSDINTCGRIQQFPHAKLGNVAWNAFASCNHFTIIPRKQNRENIHPWNLHASKNCMHVVATYICWSNFWKMHPGLYPYIFLYLGEQRQFCPLYPTIKIPAYSKNFGGKKQLLNSANRNKLAIFTMKQFVQFVSQNRHTHV